MKNIVLMFAAVALWFTGEIQAQNLTDLSVEKLSGTQGDLDLKDFPAVPDSVFLHPDRIRYDHRCFQIEGRDTYIYSGSFHYFRVPRPLWPDRFEKMRRAGFNCVETYVPWNWHEREMPSSTTDFSKVDMTELEAFLSMAETYGFYVILRPGPYICAEWDGGGFPQWIMRKRPKRYNGGGKEHGVWLQSDDFTFLQWSGHWIEAVCRVAGAHQITHKPSGEKGVILFQIENEYERVSWFTKKQKRHTLEYLAAAARKNGIDVPLLTCWTTESRNVEDGPLNGVIDMVNSYPKWNVSDRLGKLVDVQIRTQPGKPLISGELQGGWCCELGWQNFWQQDGLAPVQTQNITLYALQRGFSAINYYMVVGGTNFDDWAARNQISSYDYAAAIGEDGSTNDRYRRMTGLSEFCRTYGTSIARARLVRCAYTTTDKDVTLAVRETDNGDRYYFVRTEERSRQHYGTIKTTDMQIDFALEPFGSKVYYLPAGAERGQWFPKLSEPEVRPLYADKRGVDGQQNVDVAMKMPTIKKIGEFDDCVPKKWTTLHLGETIDDRGIYGRHYVYYKTKAYAGCLLRIERTGEKEMNSSGADTALVMVNDELVPEVAEEKDCACYRIPGDSATGEKMNVVMLYENKGLHHHVNAAVERHWHIGPAYVTSRGERQAMSFAYTEKTTGERLSVGGHFCKSRNPMLKWFVYDLSATAAKPLHLHLEHSGNGFIYVNGHCIARCWEQGPQQDYYVPECWLRDDGRNRVAICLRPNKNGASMRKVSVGE